MRAIVVGGSSGMGKAAAKHVVAQGGTVTVCSRSEEKLAAAAAEIGREGGVEGAVTTQVLDNTDEAAVAAYFASLEECSVDALIVTALGRAVHGPFLSLDTAQVKELFEGKLWG